MADPMDRFFAHPLMQWLGLGGIAYSGWSAWHAGEGWGWFLLWLFFCFIVIGAMDKVQKSEEMEPEDTDSRPPLYIRLLGHPTVAWPIITLFGGIVMLAGLAIPMNGQEVNGTLMFGIFLLSIPVVLFGRWTERRCRWKWNQLGERKRASPPPTPATIPIADIATPQRPFAAAGIPDAMRRLPPSLLELVQDGARQARARMTG